MKKIFGLVAGLALFMGACSDEKTEPNPNPQPVPEKEYATFGTPQENATYEDNTYSWSSDTDNLLPVFEFSNGELANYSSLTFTINNLSEGAAVKLLYSIDGVYNTLTPGARSGDSYSTAGTFSIDLTSLGIDLSKVDAIYLAGESESGTGSVEVNESEMYLSKEAAQTPEPEVPDSIVTGKGTITFGYCQKEINQVTGFNSAGNNGSIGGAIYVPAELAESWKGNKLTGVVVGYGYSANPQVEVFISEGRDGVDMETPVYTQNAVMELQHDWNEVILDTPYDITGKGFYVGYNTPARFGDQPLAIDFNLTSEADYNAGNFDNGAWIGINNEWVNGGPWFGRICLQLLVSGDNLPLYTISVSDLYIPSFVPQNYEFPMDFMLSNTGLDAIESVTLSVKVNGKEVAQAEAKAEKPIASGDSEWLTAYGIKVPEIGTNMNVEVQVVKVNGKSGITGQPVMTGTMSVSEKYFDKNVLIEEFTSQYCIWCPRGIVGMEYMSEHYGDKGFIGIAGHAGGSFRDEMTSNTYLEVCDAFGASLPSAVADRSYLFDPSIENNQMYYDYLMQYPSFAQIELDAQYNASTGMIEVSSQTQFALDLENSPYLLTFVLCENNVGPYPQQNIFSGGSYGDMGGWQNYGQVVMWTFQEVARYGASPLYGLYGSLPSSLKKGENYSYKINLPASTYKIEDCYVVGIIVNSRNATVVNSSKLNMGGNTKAKKPASSVPAKKINNRGAIIESAIGYEHKAQPTTKTVKPTTPRPSQLRNL